jgi:Zn-dependent protease with chaperone function
MHNGTMPAGRLWWLVGEFALPPAVVVGVILFFAVGVIASIIAFVLAAAGLAVWARLAGDRLVSDALRGRDADPTSDARLFNLVEGLSVSAGVRQPRLVVIDSPGLNAMAAGTRSSKAVLAVTTGLLEELKRIELEAVLAEELYLIRHDHTRPGTILVATFGVGRSLAIAADHDTVADLGAVSLTRYPPALASALEKIDAKGSLVPGQPASLAHLWLVDPRSDPPPSRGRLPLADRIEALREL